MPPSKDSFRTLGDRLRAKRESLGRSREDAAREIQAPVSYIEALEQNDYRVFSAKVYALGFLKKILRVYGETEPEKLIAAFQNEWDVEVFRQPKMTRSLPAVRMSRFLTARHIFVTGGAVAVGALLVFFGFRVMRFVSNPELIVDAPIGDAIIHQPFIAVMGKTEKESTLTVNGRELKIDPDGRFNEIVELTPGRVTLQFLTQNRFGRESSVTRNVLVE